MSSGIMVPARRRTPSTAARSSAGTGYISAAPGLGLGQDVNAPAGPYANSSSYQTGLDNVFVIQSAMDTSSQHQQSVDFNHTLADGDIARTREDELECKSESDNADYASGEERQPNKRAKKKRYHRHTQHQIQVMEAFFKECPHPDDKQRKELSRELGLEPLQVKFWFQNKRTQMKTHHERQENQELRVENEKLRTENMRYRGVLATASCTNCGGPTNAGEMSFEEQQLMVENARLRAEIEKMSALASGYIGRPVGPNLFVPLEFPTGNLGGPSNLAVAHNILIGTGEMTRTPVLGRFPGENPAADRPGVVQLAVNAMEELSRVAHAGEPLWTPGSEGNSEVLNQEEYRRAFPRAAGAAAAPFGMRAEATRENSVVVMSNPKLLDLLMDVNKWSIVFSSIVSRAATLEVLSTGVAGNYNGALQVMTAEFQMPSPLVPTRDSCFLRYCKKFDDDTWAVADVSLDTLHPNPLLRCRRRPSGCIIREMPNGYSKVIWVEHMEVDDRTVHRIYRPLVNSGLAFGAKRWISILDRQCERIASFISNSLPSGDASVITTKDGKRSMLNLAERMVISFCSCVGASIAHHWTTLSGTCGEDVRVMTRKSVDDPGRPPGIVLSASTSLWLPAPPRRVFDFLRNENNRSEWDILSNGGVVEEMARIDNGRDEGNCISLLRVNSPNANQSNMLILQESCTDATASFVVYAPVDLVSMNAVLNGGDPDYVALLPSGFAVLPDAHPGDEDSGDGDAICGGSLLTVAFQILVDSQPQAKLSLGSVATVNSLIACTIDRIRSSVLEHSQ